MILGKMSWESLYKFARIGDSGIRNGSLLSDVWREQ